MPINFKFSARYAVAAAVVFLVEVLTFFIGKGAVRHTLGDVLAVILVALALRALTSSSIRWSALTALGVAFAIEGFQLTGVVSESGLDANPLIAATLGSTFAMTDLLAYTAGTGLYLGAEWLFKLP
ncbi:MAG: DUF2809 domain-containing protein [Pseudomonadota bacterium]